MRFRRTLILVLLLAGCSPIDQQTRTKLQDYVNQHPELWEHEKRSILNRQVKVGMTQEATDVVLDGIYCQKEIIEYEGVLKEKRVCEQHNLYLENGKVYAIDDSDVEWAWFNENRRVAYIKNTPELSEEHKNLIKKGSVVIGMNQDEVKASLGEPSEINKSVYSFSVHEQWIYPSDRYLYFEDGILQSYQTRN